jgi:hypothetical protein
MKTAIQQCAQDLFETDLSHDVKTKIVDILHKHLMTEKEQIKEAVMHGLWNNEIVEMDNYSEIYYNETFEVFSNDSPKAVA